MELQQGIMLETEDGVKVGESVTAAKTGISMVTLSRIGMAAPGKKHIFHRLFNQNMTLLKPLQNLLQINMTLICISYTYMFTLSTLPT